MCISISKIGNISIEMVIIRTHTGGASRGTRFTNVHKIMVCLNIAEFNAVYLAWKITAYGIKKLCKWN